ncbi:SLOG family protein [Bacillus pumilus]|uniref:SLOG family protein n=1 Tax=Bacillus pumilus TaxID=1408 RepID=UPI002280B527|nr:SLOG family protein [Bacillus pumilus]MCY7679902.1 SLOG family protein [Bacillus pumilus]
MPIDFKKLSKQMSDPEWIKQQEKEREEEKRTFEESEKIRHKTVCFTGHRPQKLGGYDMKNPTMLKLKEKLLEVIEKLIEENESDRFITGGALGADTAAFWCVHIMKEKYPHIKNIVALPFENQDKKWSAEQQAWYRKMLDKADEVIKVDEIKNYKNNTVPTGEYSVEKLSRRNEYMVDHSKSIVAIYDGSRSGTSNCLYYAQNRYLGHTIWRLFPQYDFELEVYYTPS